MAVSPRSRVNNGGLRLKKIAKEELEVFYNSIIRMHSSLMHDQPGRRFAIFATAKHNYMVRLQCDGQNLIPYRCHIALSKAAHLRIYNFLLSHRRGRPGVRPRITALGCNHQALECMIPTCRLETSLLGRYSRVAQV